MNVTKELDRRRLPCGPLTVSIESVCRRRVRDLFDIKLDSLTREIHPEGHDLDKAKLIQDGKKKFEAKKEVDKLKPEKPEESAEERKERLLREGKLKLDVKSELAKYEEKVMPKTKQKTSDHTEPDEETDKDELQGNSRLLQRLDGKMTRWQGKG